MIDSVYTIGHSTHSVETLLELLTKHSITAVCDVRSHPYSRANPQFNRESLKTSLKDAGIKYVFLGKELGARSADRDCYLNGQVQYHLLAETDLFKCGIERVKEGAHKYRIALMCAEKEPLDCHRTILIARKLYDDGIAIKHILSDGQLEEHTHTIERLIERLNISGPDMFREHDAVIADAYAQRGNEIAYREKALDESDSEGVPYKKAIG